MRVREYLCEITNTVAYWISPYGEITEVGVNHIDTVIKHPEVFDLKLDDIKRTYEKYGEELGSEGKAREEIIKGLVNDGWTRIRRYRSQYSVNIKQLNKNMKDRLYSWADKLITKGIKGMVEKDIYMPVSIVPISGPAVNMDIGDIAHDKLYEGSEAYDIKNAVYLREEDE